MLTIGKQFRFEAAHNLPEHNGKCRNLHGHSYMLEVCLSGRDLHNEGPQKGMLLDFGILGTIVRREIVDKLDHTNLNESFGANPTAENMASEFAYTIRSELDSTITSITVRVWETETSWAECTI